MKKKNKHNKRKKHKILAQTRGKLNGGSTTRRTDSEIGLDIVAEQGRYYVGTLQYQYRDTSCSTRYSQHKQTRSRRQPRLILHDYTKRISSRQTHVQHLGPTTAEQTTVYYPFISLQCFLFVKEQIFQKKKKHTQNWLIVRKYIINHSP